MSKASLKSGRSVKSNRQTSLTDMILWILITLLFVVGLGATYYYQAFAAPLKLSAWILLLLLVGGLFLRTKTGRAFGDFAKKAKVELRKVVWPTRQETVQTTAIVGFIVFVTSFMLWVMDSGLVWLAGLATGQRG